MRVEENYKLSEKLISRINTIYKTVSNVVSGSEVSVSNAASRILEFKNTILKNKMSNKFSNSLDDELESKQQNGDILKPGSENIQELLIAQIVILKKLLIFFVKIRIHLITG